MATGPRDDSRTASALSHLALGFLLLGALRTVGAQASTPEVRVELGQANIRQSGSDVTSAALMAANWRRPSERFTLLTGGNLTYARDSVAAAQAVVAISVPWGLEDRWRTEVGVTGASYSLRTAGRGGNTALFTRHHLIGRTRGAWVGGTKGWSTRDGIPTESHAGDAGVWQRIGPFYFAGSGTYTKTADRALLISSGLQNPLILGYFEFFDAQFIASARNGPHDFTLSLTQRAGVGRTETQSVGISASGTLQLTDRIALVGIGGRQLADPLRGSPQADLIGVSVRYSFGPQPLPVMQRSLIAETEVIPIIGGGGELAVRVFATDTMVIEVAGDFSDWKPIPLVREGPFFVARVNLPPGKHRVAVRVNLGVWRAPRNLARVRDDYGGEAGLVVIP